MVREVLYRCFFTLKLSKILDPSSGRFFFLSWINFQVFMLFFGFLCRSMGLSRCLDYFQGVFGKKKWVKKLIFRSK